MRRFVFIFIFVPTIVFAQTETWLVGNAEINFTRTSDGILINPSCLKNKSCLAMKALRNKKMNSSMGDGGKNPGSEACKSGQGNVIIAHRGHTTQGFCRFGDNSFLSLDGLLKP